MRGLTKNVRSGGAKWRAILLAPLCALVFITPVSSARLYMTIKVANNSGRDMLHIYLSPTDRNAWGPDQLAQGTALRNGQEMTLNEVTCAGNEIQVIAEDEQGCFVYGVVSCAEGSGSWDIAKELPVDCGN